MTSTRQQKHSTVPGTREYPILFSAPMVRALLEDRKFVTRRLSKQWLKVKAGDRLWVRETWIEGFPTGEPRRWSCIRPTGYKDHGMAFYRAGGEDAPDGPQRPWHPSIHMPRWASRILLECEEDPRVERLQDITEEEAQLEGVETLDRPMYADETLPTYRNAFIRLWRALHTKPGERWEDNPEVVRVGRFHRVPVTLRSSVEPGTGERLSPASGSTGAACASGEQQ